MIEISKREGVLSTRILWLRIQFGDTNKWRQENNKDRIIRGIKFYN